nr:carboxy terminal-processing peptidase [Chitinophagaceae bacterium]
AQNMSSFEKYKYSIDEEFKNGSTEFYKLVQSKYLEQLPLVKKYALEALDKPFTFDGNDEIDLSGKKQSYALNNDELKNRWEKSVKYRTLVRFVELKEEQEKAIIEKVEKEKTNKIKTIKVNQIDTLIKTEIELEQKARESVKKNMEYYFRRLDKIGNTERFGFYCNAITQYLDPHTNFFAPQDKKRFDESMSGAFFGIGAVLQSKEGVCSISQIVTGSPCFEQGSLKVGDVILKVAQGEEEPVDINGWDLEDVVQIIRGKKGSEVRLTTKHLNGSIEIIPIIRDKVEMEATFAKSIIINEGYKKFGFILLPEFYADFGGNNGGRRCSVDIQKEIEKLKAEKVDGIILDLRNNGGGSLGDVVDIAGFFIPSGPVVQVKSRDSKPEQLYDENPGVLWEGPLAIMINGNSASASEILAAAIQDYKRGIIIGSNSFGKGTVQRVFNLDDFYRGSAKSVLLADGSSSELKPLGSLKLTVQKFYRINGGSTQLKGVTPDVIIPDSYDLLDLGEKKDKHAIPWDQIASADYEPYKIFNLNTLIAKSNIRVQNNPIFGLIGENAKRLKEQFDNNTYSLNEKKYKEEIAEAKKISDKMEELNKNKTLLKTYQMKVDLDLIASDTAAITKSKDFQKLIQKDAAIFETVNIMKDWNTLLPLSINAKK